MSTSTVLYDAPGPRAGRRHRLFGVATALLVLTLVGVVVWRLLATDQFSQARVAQFQYAEVQRELLDIDQFMTADITAGEQDLLCLVEAGNYEELLQTVMKRLRAVKGVTRTMTDLILETT